MRPPEPQRRRLRRLVWLTLVVVSAGLGLLVVAGPLAILLVVAFVGLVALGDNMIGLGGFSRSREELRRTPGPLRPPENLRAEPYDDQAWAREWVRATEKANDE